MNLNQRKLRVVKMPTTSSTRSAPPILDAYGTLEFTCGRCETVLLIADERQLPGMSEAMPTSSSR